MASTQSALTSSSTPELGHPVRGYLAIAAAGLCWGICAALGRAVFTGKLLGSAVHPVDPLILSQTRTTITFLILAGFLLPRRGLGVFRMPRRDLLRCLVLGVVGMAFCNYSYYYAIERTNVATAITLQYAAPVLVLLYMVMRGRQRATLQRVGSVVMGVVGIALAIGVVGRGRFHVDLKGLIAAEVSAVTFAYYNIAGGAMLKRLDRWRLLLLVQLAAALWWNVVNPPWRVLAAQYSAAQWLFLIGFALLSALIPASLYLVGLRHLDATRAVVTSCLEPVFTILIAVLALGEGLRALQVVGIVIVLTATIAVQLPEKGHEPAPIVEPVD